MGRRFGSLLLLFLAAVPVLAQQPAPPAPRGLVVERSEDMFRGRWEPVPGVSHYEVWVKKFGRWSFDPKDLLTSPFTSSFAIPVEDERALFRVRAVSPSGLQGEYSAETAAREKPPEAERTEPTSATRSGPSTGFDPKAPPPKPPTSLFAIWTEPRTIQLVWQESEGATSYAVEEWVGNHWSSIPRISFPKPTTALIEDHPAPGPYKFRVRAVGANGRASEPSRPTTARR